MSTIKRTLLTAALVCVVTNAAQFSGHVLPSANQCAAYAQSQSDSSANRNTTQSPVREKDEPTDAAVVLYRVMGTVLVVWIGLAIFLFRIDRKLTRLQKDVRSRK